MSKDYKVEIHLSGIQFQSSFTMVDRPSARQPINNSAPAPSTTTATTAKSKEDPYAKPGVGKCYRCGELGQRSNECPKRRQDNMADYEDDGEEEAEIEDLNDSDFSEEQGTL